MIGTRTFRGMMERCKQLKEQYALLLDMAEKDGSTLAQYAGPERLEKLVDEINDLISESLKLSTPSNRYEIQAEIVPLLYTVEQDYCDAMLFKCDPAADFGEYASPSHLNYSLA